MKSVDEVTAQNLSDAPSKDGAGSEAGYSEAGYSDAGVSGPVPTRMSAEHDAMGEPLQSEQVLSTRKVEDLTKADELPSDRLNPPSSEQHAQAARKHAVATAADDLVNNSSSGVSSAAEAGRDSGEWEEERDALLPLPSREPKSGSERLNDSPKSMAPDVYGLAHVARVLLDAKYAVLFVFEGEAAVVRARSTEIFGAEIDRIVAQTRKLRLEKPRYVPDASKANLVPEVGLFPASLGVASLISFPVKGKDQQQLATLVLADTRARPQWSERALPAVQRLLPMLAWALTERDKPRPRRENQARDLRPSELPAPPSTDPVTGLLDEEEAVREIDRRLRLSAEGSHECSLAVVSMDRFRRINDSFGHAIGDVLLRHVAERLTNNIGDKDLVARRSGDEFMVLLDHRSSESPMSKLDRILQSVKDPFYLQGQEIEISVSIGTSAFPRDGEAASELLRSADIALTRSKQKGQGKIQVFDASMQASARERMEIEYDLKRAIREGEFILFYQAKFNMDGTRIVGAEALVRWKHPQQGLVSPLRFIPVAEETGLIIPLGAFCLLQACRERKSWLDQGFEAGRVSVNVSAKQFARLDFPATVREALSATALPPELLEIELTESSLMDDVDQTAAHLRMLREMGVRVSVDDFGTGYSSLAYLQKFPVDVLKIDRSFVRTLDGDGGAAPITPASSASARALVQAITYLGHSLGLVVLAEGVETKAQLEALAELGCDEVQGFLFAKPIPEKDFVELLKKHATT